VCVVRLINFSHSAGTEQTVKAIVSDLPRGHENRPLPQKEVTTPSRRIADVRACLGIRHPARA
jgi:hypothetical protein